ncbi:hypothetical protein TW65_01213 [Stemphylium lycopersici]|nr:hypothetical protein TW65_01213 [Stemphylium lycopersici]
MAHPCENVAIVGSGLAGLLSANLLAKDARKRYAVKVFESGKSLSLDAASFSVPNAAGDGATRVDLPMRAFAGGYYKNLKALYDYLGVRYREQPFLFEFAESSKNPAAPLLAASRDASYFVHASNLHQLPPRPSSVGRIRHALQWLYLVAAYTWFALCCFLVEPGRGETLQQYLHRTWIPHHFVTWYLLPLLSSVSTCPHSSLLAFPASDIIGYKCGTHGAPHYTVSDGVAGVQERLIKGIHVTLNATITAVEPGEKGVSISWSQAEGAEMQTEHFDRVILAVAPDVVGRVFKPLQHHMRRIPTALVESVVHTDWSIFLGSDARKTDRKGAQLIHLNTSTSDTHKTESHHMQPCGVIVTTCPCTPLADSQTLHTATFTRVLRTPESQRIVNAVFGNASPPLPDDKSVPLWKNGDDNVWLVGGWCWDGMVLLEGCVVSAMRVADAFGVEVPTAMWMNMGYWKDATASTTLSEACRDLLETILAQAGFERGAERERIENGTRPRRCLIDLGFGCGDQTICLMSDGPLRPCDKEWWSARGRCATFDHYIGITKDKVQAKYASERIDELKHSAQSSKDSSIFLACSDAAVPALWDQQLHKSIRSAKNNSDECWVLALDTAYHFSPSRWPLIRYARSELKASFMAFDLCLSPSATLAQRLTLRLLTTLMGAPWKNFVTPQQYRQKLIELGYDTQSITITDISDHVFTPLSTFLGRQDMRLRTLGLGIGSFGVAKTMFEWWAHERMQRSRASSLTAREPVVRLLTTPTWPIITFALYATLVVFTWTVACTMALADQGWLSPRIWNHVSHLGSLPFYVAFGLTLIGSAFQIFQQVIVQAVPVRIPTTGTEFTLAHIPDVPGLINAGAAPSNPDNTDIVRLRSTLNTLYEDHYEPLMWAPESFLEDQCDRYPAGPICDGLNMPKTFGLLKKLVSGGGNPSVPWIAPVPSGFNTGAHKMPQYVPRINTTIAYTNVTAADWPSECERGREDVFFAEYHNELDDDYFDTGVVVCMTTNITESPWQATHNKQDITESLYLNITARDIRNYQETTFFKATAESTLGYFELPSAYNGNQPGPLLGELMLEDTGEVWGAGSSSPEAKRATNATTYPGDVLQRVGKNLGPLTTLGLALFGEGSFIETSFTNLSSYIPNRPVDPETLENRFTSPLTSGNCMFLSPMIFFDQRYGDPCIRDWDVKYDSGVIGLVDNFLGAFGSLDETHQALTMAASLANKIWFSGMKAGSSLNYRNTRTLKVDPGVKTIKTDLSVVRIIFGSLLVGAHLLGLLALVIYSVIQQPFVPWLGSTVMVKAGTAYAEILSAAEGDKQWKDNTAACAGFIGDQNADGDRGKMTFGAVAGLSTKSLRKYEDL